MQRWEKIGAVSPVYNVFSINTKMVISDFVEKYVKGKEWISIMEELYGSSREGESISVKQYFENAFFNSSTKRYKMNCIRICN